MGDVSTEKLWLAPGEKLILASASPRRRELLRQIGVAHECLVAEIDEYALAGEDAAAMVLRLAAMKAGQVAAQCPGRLVLGADTVVVHEQKIYGKPDDLADARGMLRDLSGQKHQVLTGVCLRRSSCDGQPEAVRSWVCRSEVTFRALSDAAIDKYFSLVNPLDKAGAYAIQEHGEMLVEKLDGLLSNVIGLPVEELFGG